MRSLLQIWSHLLKKSLMENFFLCSAINLFLFIVLLLYPLKIPENFPVIQAQCVVIGDYNSPEQPI